MFSTSDQIRENFPIRFHPKVTTLRNLRSGLSYR